jgi:hypothetical protein
MRLWLLVAWLTALVAAGCGGGGGSPEGGATGPAASALGWRELPGSPLSGRTGAVLVGVGGTAYVIGGWEFLCPPTADCVMPREAALSDGAAVDLDTGQWQGIADAPVPVHHTEAGVVGGVLELLRREWPAVPLREPLRAFETHAEHLAHERLISLLVSEPEEAGRDLGVEDARDPDGWALNASTFNAFTAPVIALDRTAVLVYIYFNSLTFLSLASN